MEMVDNIRTDVKLPPRATFTAQVIGTLLGAVLNYSKTGWFFSCSF